MKHSIDELSETEWMLFHFVVAWARGTTPVEALRWLGRHYSKRLLAEIASVVVR